MSNRDIIKKYLGDVSCEEVKTEIISNLKRKGFYLLNLDNEFLFLIESAFQEYKRIIDEKKVEILATNSSFRYKEIKNNFFGKYSIGAYNGIKDPIAQLLQTIYLPTSKKQILNSNNYLFKLAEYLVFLRNYICNMDPLFGYNPIKEKFWNASRIHHYPIGGGFMSCHNDTSFPKIMKNNSVPFLQISVSLSMKGRDYFKGGGYVFEKENNKKIYTDRNQNNPSSITFFDGSIFHGVDDVDPDSKISFNSKNMRAALFTSLFPYIG